MLLCAHNQPQRAKECGDEGFMLLAAVVAVFIVLLTLSIAAPRVAKQIQRDRELESQHRAQQYVRAVRIFYLKFKRYPTSLEQLEKTNNQRFLRQRYVDPLTGKDDWRLIHVGENQTKVKGFFGDDLPGLPAMSGGGLGSASGMASTTGGSGSPGLGNSGLNANAAPGLGNNGAAGSLAPMSGNNAQSALAFGGASAAGNMTAGGAPGQTAGASGLASSGSSGIASQDATSFTGSGAGPIMGIGSARSGEAMLVVNDQASYETWEFLYDPRIELLYAKGNLLGGISSGSGTSGGFGTPMGNGTPIGTPVGTPIGGNPASPSTPPANMNPVGVGVPQ